MALAATLTLLAWAPPALCQGAAPGPITIEPGAQPEKSPPALPQKPSIRMRVTEVTTPVVVRDRSGSMVFNLAQKDFHVFDNGIEQRIQHFDLGGEPLSIVLAVETSSHAKPLLPAVRQTGIIFSQVVMASTAEAAVIGFDDSVNLLEKFTADPDAIQAAINHLPDGTSGERLYDAMARGIDLLSEQPEGRRRVLLVVGEAHDTGSEAKLGEVLRKAQLANVTIYSVGLSTSAADWRAQPTEGGPAPIGPPGTFPVPIPGGLPQTPEVEAQMQGNMNLLALAEWLVKTGKTALGRNSLAVASKATGGLHVNTLKDRSIEKAMDEIGGELHAEYTLGYRPSDGDVTGYHEIKVAVNRHGVTVRSRPGYYLAPPE
jgi:VWFA-related protein